MLTGYVETSDNDTEKLFYSIRGVADTVRKFKSARRESRGSIVIKQFLILHLSSKKKKFLFFTDDPRKTLSFS